MLVKENANDANTLQSFFLPLKLVREVLEDFSTSVNLSEAILSYVYNIFNWDTKPPDMAIGQVSCVCIVHPLHMETLALL